MDKENLIELTIKLYNLTLLFPKKEPLRYQMRNLADSILQNTILTTNPSFIKTKGLIIELQKDIEVLNNFFEVARSQNWVSPSEILNLQQNYSKVKGDIPKIPSPARQLETKLIKKNYNISSGHQASPRHEKILSVLREKERLQVRDLKEIFPHISKRTFRRDFEHLMNKGLVIRIGEKNNTFYQLPDRISTQLR